MKYFINIFIFLTVFIICNAYDEITSEVRNNKQSNISNKVSYIHVLGLDGSGVSTISTSIVMIANTCNQHVIYQNKLLKKARQKGQSTYFISYIKNRIKYDTTEVTIIEDSAFPIDGILSYNLLPQERKKEYKNNIEWIYKHIDSISDVKQKYVYVQKEFYSTVMTSLKPEEKFENRVQVLRDFQQYIDMEYKIINNKSNEKNIWKQISYEWFRDMENCTVLVSAVIDYIGFTNCDVDFACELLSKLLPNTNTTAATSTTTPTISTTSETVGNITYNKNIELINYARNHSYQLSIPLLDVSNNYTHYQYNNIRTTRKYTETMQSLLQATTTNAFLIPENNDHTSNYINNRETGIPLNNITYVYIAGVEGTGHHGVTPAIATIAKTCNYHVIYENNQLREASIQYQSDVYISILNKYKHAPFTNTNNILILEDQSFPTDTQHRISNIQTKKACSKYNIEWIYNQTLEAGVNMKFFYLTRDFYRTVASHPEFDGTFQQHAKVLYDFIWYIYSEYVLINQKQKNIWKQISYESFRDMENCTVLVSAVIDYIGFTHCDVDFACHILGQTIRNSMKKIVNKMDFIYANSMNVSLPIPLLDITANNKTYTFNTVISERIPFSFVKNVTHSKNHSFRTRVRTNTSTKPRLSHSP